jgi:hypothetical protein
VCYQKPVSWPQCKLTNESSVFKEKEIRLLFVRQRGRQGRVNLSKLSFHFCPLFKGESRGSAWLCDEMHVLEWVLVLGLSHLSEAVCLDWLVYLSGGQREIRGRRLPGLIEE